MNKGVLNYVADFFWKPSQKTSRTQVLLAGGGSDAVWSEKNYKTFADEAYLKNVIAYTCITRVAQAVASVPWLLYEIDEEGKKIKIDNHELMTLIRRSNPADSFNYLIMKTVAFLLLDGNAYLEKVPRTVNKGIAELYSLRPDYMQITKNSTTGALRGYTYTVNGRTIDFPVELDGSCDILQLKNFHPTDDWYGAAATASAGYEIDTDNERAKWNKGLLENQARPGMIFISNSQLTDKQFERLESQLKVEYAGGENAGKNLVLEGGTDAKPYGWNAIDLEFIEGGREVARKISMSYGYPSMLLGIPGDNTYSNYTEARLALYEDTVSYYLNYLKAELNNWLLKDQENILLDYDLSGVPALESRRKEKWQTAETSTFLTINEKRDMVGLESIGDVGDVIMVSAAMVPLGEEPDYSEEVPQEEPETEPIEKPESDEEDGTVE
jgi:HK97 family phage portal protein